MSEQWRIKMTRPASLSHLAGGRVGEKVKRYPASVLLDIAGEQVEVRHEFVEYWGDATIPKHKQLEEGESADSVVQFKTMLERALKATREVILFALDHPAEIDWRSAINVSSAEDYLNAAMWNYLTRYEQVDTKQTENK